MYMVCKKQMDNNENLYLSTIAFMDDDAITTNNRYLAEFCKIVIYQNGYLGLTISEICKKINELVLFTYSEEEIEKILESDVKSFECEDGVYTITSDVTDEISKRAKAFLLRKYVDLFCDTKYKDVESTDRNALCGLVTKYIFEKFQQSIDQISNILDSTKEIRLNYSDRYTDAERTFLNSFLAWDNDEKNKMIYDLIVKSYDFCTINCTKENTFDFKEFHFYLDANIIMRLLGINNTYRQDAVKHFIEKCKQEKIKLHITNFTKFEIKKSIEHQIAAIDKEIKVRQHFPTPTAMKFAKPDSFTMEMYGKFYEYGNKNKTWSLEAFKRALMNQLDNCIKEFIYDDNDSFEVEDAERFKGYFLSLREIKDEKVVKTDVNNVMFVLKIREKYPDSYMISADGKLINWCKDIFVGKSSVIEFPSIWFSIIMKYTGRASNDDYTSFCRFIRLPIYASDKDIRTKIEVKKHILSMQVTEKIKNRMFEELENNYMLYSDCSTGKQIAEKAYEKVMLEHDDGIKKQIEAQTGIVIDEMKQKLESAKQSLIVKIREKDKLLEQQKKETVPKKIEEEINRKVEKRLCIGKWIADYYNRILSIMIIGLIVGFVIAINCIGTKIPVSKEVIGFILSIVEFSIGIVLTIFLNAIKEYFTNEERLQKKFKRKLNKKYKALL